MTINKEQGAFEIHPATPNQVADIFRIENEAYDVPESIESLETYVNCSLAEPQKYQFLVATIGQDVIGFCQSNFSTPRAVIVENVAVDATHRRTGVASALVSAVLSQMKSKRKIAATATVRCTRIAASGLLRKCGFFCREESLLEDTPVYKFRYTVPFDSLSDKHLSSLAKKTKDRRSSEGGSHS